MSKQQIIHDAVSPAISVETRLNELARDQQLTLDDYQVVGKWTATIWDMGRHEALKYGYGETPAAAILDLHEPHEEKYARNCIPEREWTTEDPLSPAELDELKKEQSAS